LYSPTDASSSAAVALASALLGALAPSAAAQNVGANTAASSLSAAYSYTGVLQSNVAGGRRRGTTFSGAAALQFTLMLDRLVPWRGTELFVFLLDTHGGVPTDLVGSLQAVSGIEAPPGLRLEELWLQQNAFANRFSVLIGRYDLNTEFYRLQSAALFVHSSLGIGPEFAQSGVAGPSTFPYTAVGARADFKPSANVVWRAAVLNGSPVDRPGGGARLFARGDGALLVAEVAALDRPESAATPRDRRFQIGRGMVRTYSRKVALGVWHYTASFPDLADVLPNGDAVQHKGSSGAYLIADQSLWTAPRGGARALTAFAQLGLGDSRVNRVGRYVGGGLTLTGPLPRRAQDQVGLAGAVALLGSHYKRMLTPASSTVASETALELTYLAQLNGSLAVQADLEYVVSPGGSRTTRNALMPGLRIALAR
jgi:porin